MLYPIYVNMDVALLGMRLLAKYLIKICNMTRIKADSWILYKKGDNGKLDLVISVHADDVFLAGRTEKL